jgi:transposase-like protein
VATKKEHAMTKKTCQRCGASDYVRNGNVRQLQRYLCKSCGCHCTDTPPRGKPPAMKALAVLFYSIRGYAGAVR